MYKRVAPVGLKHLPTLLMESRYPSGTGLCRPNRSKLLPDASWHLEPHSPGLTAAVTVYLLACCLVKSLSPWGWEGREGGLVTWLCVITDPGAWSAAPDLAGGRLPGSVHTPHHHRHRLGANCSSFPMFHFMQVTSLLQGFSFLPCKWKQRPTSQAYDKG